MTRTTAQKIVGAVAAVLALVLAVVAIVAGIAVGGMWAGQSRYASGHDADSAQFYRAASKVLPEQLDRWEAYFGQGTAQIRAGNVEGGVATLAVALQFVPKDADAGTPTNDDEDELTPECRVRMNMAVGQEILGDRQFAAGYFAEAEQTFTQASQTVEQCVPQGENPQQQKKDTDTKASDARERNKENPGGDKPGGEEPTGGDEPGGEEPTGEDPPSTSELKLRELAKRAAEAERLRRQGEGLTGGYGGYGGENW
ncbi:tetratricopeptide repeat protein [Trueperella bialowiezensis]|uniref:Uncharacterized protein n=1 Tax=Trueperella bialowiezensis TaxID=312285 RepID=A0A3S4X663_9ACTO|nr:tetratricopeptide repeat protein [Trueperella bialowiezensis]VEI13495.1 Uncharacterised protein [Trueperella bialowiezensis]